MSGFPKYNKNVFRAGFLEKDLRKYFQEKVWPLKPECALAVAWSTTLGLFYRAVIFNIKISIVYWCQYVNYCFCRTFLLLLDTSTLFIDASTSINVFCRTFLLLLDTQGSESWKSLKVARSCEW